MTTPTIPLFLDCDTGVDDALALAYLLDVPHVDLVGIGTVSGNIDSTTAAVNTSALLGMVGRSVPVAVGAHDPLGGAYGGGAPHVHGVNGVGGVDLPAGVAAADDPAAELLVRLARSHAAGAGAGAAGTRKLDVLAIGPLTNLAVALELEPRLPELIGTLTIMGGAVWEPGNVSATAEANIHNDAEAARRVLTAGFDLVLVPLDVTRQHRFDDADGDRFIAAGDPLRVALGTMLHRYIDFYETVDHVRRAPLHDPLAAAITAGEVAPTVRETPLDVVTDGAEHGRTVPVEQGPAVRVVVAADAAAADVIRNRILALAAVPA
ncbi:nucleoside hydrolase [Curtobacterium sp. PhB136]|uniref:nucleoside hydrolase n=1 Tax=Curtobacterium sp. PhB136 TaxID=2485181 RepID=UPI001047B787|nr:nucleoside hydrolase [Curtobacterium sp. PhB136]TCK66070.1 purine nucleosidase [Curtobacterium sp. PhB136]